MVLIKLTLFGSGCLPDLIASKIRKVEEHQRIVGDRYSKEESESIFQYLAQLNECLAAVDEARRVAVGRPTTDARVTAQPPAATTELA